MHELQKVYRHVQYVVKNTNGIFPFIAKGLEFKYKEILLQSYRMLVRPRLEFSA